MGGGTDSTGTAGETDTESGAASTGTDTEAGGATTGSAGGDPIPIGSLMPVTGALSDFGANMQKSVETALGDVNDAGGPLGRELNLHARDTETKPAKALQKYNAMQSEQGIVGLVGAASSGVTVPIAQKVGSDQVTQISPASTTPALAELGYGQSGDGPKYFARTAPNDGQAGIVMGRILGNDEYMGVSKAGFLYVDNPYGKGLAEQAKATFEGDTVSMVGYSKRATDYSSTLDTLYEGGPEGVGFIGYPGNGGTILKQWSEGGYGGEWALSVGLNSKDFLGEYADITDGMYLQSERAAETDGTERFRQKMGGDFTVFAPHSYDALFLIALAIHRAGEATGRAIAENLRAVSRPPGEKVTVGEFERAKELLDGGDEVNYQGASSPVDLSPNLEPITKFAIMQVNDGTRETREVLDRSFFEGKL
jgi:branched-chain amino acid transport system substrate-binding protein